MRVCVLRGEWKFLKYGLEAVDSVGMCGTSLTERLLSTWERDVIVKYCWNLYVESQLEL